MKTNAKKFHKMISPIIILILSCLWCWRYYSINKQFDTLTNITNEEYKIGDQVFFENDYIEYRQNANGYWLRVDDFEIIDCRSYFGSHSFDEPKQPELLAFVYVTLGNDSNTTDEIILTEFILHSINANMYVSWDMLIWGNPILDGHYGIRLPIEETCSLVLPFYLYRDNFNSRDWNNINKCELFLQITSYPTIKNIVVQ